VGTCEKVSVGISLGNELEIVDGYTEETIEGCVCEECSVGTCEKVSVGIPLGNELGVEDGYNEGKLEGCV